MAKNNKTVFFCQECGYESPKWQGQCICGAWNSFVEEKVKSVTEEKNMKISLSNSSRPTPLNKVSKSFPTDRFPTGINELDRVLGGGIFPGSLTLISGEPGIGKSTIIMQVANYIANTIGKVLYISGEESEEQLKLRADRICPSISDNLLIFSETNLDVVEKQVEETSPSFIIVDSIQTMYASEISSSPGSISQVRTCGGQILKIAKTNNIPVFIVAHVTKSGELAGPKIVEHLVDCVLSFTGERTQDIRIIRSNKNRFGTTSEVGAFSMEEKGLVEIPDISKVFLDQVSSNQEGSIIGAAYEGTRPLFLEVQGLAAPTTLGFPRRTVVGFDLARLNMILAVLEKKGGLPLSSQDIYVNIVGGIKPEGTYTDLAIALAIYSSFRGKSLPEKTVVLGELGLTGELRGIQNTEKIVREAVRMGLKNLLLPYKNYISLKEKSIEGLNLIGLKDINDAIQVFK